jgi:serine protease Do
MRALRHVMHARASNWAICLLSASFIAVAVSNWTKPAPASAQGPSAAAKPVTSESKALLAAFQNAFVTIADNVEPSVVTIEARATTSPKSASPMPLPLQGDDLPEPFKDFLKKIPRPDAPDMQGTSTGSGVILRENGNTAFVLTNNHVVDGRDRVRVHLWDRTELPATIVGRDERTDLAVLKVQTRKPLPAGSVARLGNSDGVKAGQWAIAIGSPLGYESTLTVGVISAKGRELNHGFARTVANYVDLIQTDASINPGNSGGPLVNIEGEVIGINVAIAAGLGNQGNIGIGFAIPINSARAVAEQLISSGKVTRGYLGVGVSTANRELSPELRQQLHVAEGGALVETVTPDGPAGRAGMKEGDVIVRFGDRTLRSFTDLEKAVSTTKPGSTVSAEVIRDGKPVRLSITVMERPAESALLTKPETVPGSGEGGDAQPVKSRYGLSLRPGGSNGAVIAAVAPGSPAAEAGLRPGDVIVSVGDRSVSGADAFQKAAGALNEQDPAVLRVRTPGGLRFVVVRP